MKFIYLPRFNEKGKISSYYPICPKCFKNLTKTTSLTCSSCTCLIDDLEFDLKENEETILAILGVSIDEVFKIRDKTGISDNPGAYYIDSKLRLRQVESKSFVYTIYPLLNGDIKIIK